jgi:hypothetical protein
MPPSGTSQKLQILIRCNSASDLKVHWQLRLIGANLTFFLSVTMRLKAAS